MNEERRIALAPEGRRPVAGWAGAAAALLVGSRVVPEALGAALAVAGGLAALGAAFLASFFRDPRREAPGGEGLVVSPADGKVIVAEEVEETRFLGSRATKVSIFMSPLDVHVNRAPIDGEVVEVRYNPGKYLAAFSDKASLDNEQNAIVMQVPDGRRVVFVQIAGLVARRIVCRVRERDLLRRGQRVGMIKLGSRVDIYVPGRFTLRVRAGDRVLAGVTVLGVL